jgi:hypothetical protein
MSTPDIVLALLDGSSLDQIHLSAQELAQRLLHIDEIEQSPSLIVVEGHQEVQVALGAKAGS